MVRVRVRWKDPTPANVSRLFDRSNQAGDSLSTIIRIIANMALDKLDSRYHSFNYLSKYSCHAASVAAQTDLPIRKQPSNTDFE